MKKNENGVTLIALAIMVIVMLMIASVTVYSGVISIIKTKKNKNRIGNSSTCSIRKLY